MRVQEALTRDGRVRYLLVTDDGDIVEPVARYLKYLDATGKARNTIRAYCYHLKLYFEFLSQQRLDYRRVGLDDLASFLRWLRSPFASLRVIPAQPVKEARTVRTVNMVISTVTDFYDYLLRTDRYQGQLPEQLRRTISASRRRFKGLLHHVARAKPVQVNVLQMREPRRCRRVLGQDEVQRLLDACSNSRDRLLLALLYQAQLRIGEALALWLEDFDVTAARLSVADRGELINAAEIKSFSSPRTVHVSRDLVNLFLDYVAEYHTEVSPNCVFLKIAGPARGSPMTYADVDALFRRLRKKTGIAVTPHTLRHTGLTELFRAGMRPEAIQRRAGHAHAQTTLQTYVHPSEEDLRQEWEKAEARRTSRAKGGTAGEQDIIPRNGNPGAGTAGRDR